MCLQTPGDYEEDGYGKGEWPRKRFIRRTRINFTGMTCVILYLIALGFYIWVRASLPLNPKP